MTGDLAGRPRRWLRWLAVAAVTTGLVLGALIHAGSMLVVTRELEAPQAILSLGSHEWERLPAAAALATEHPDASVLLSEPVRANPYNCHRCSERVRWLEQLGVLRRRTIVLPRRVMNTYDEANAALDYCRRHGIKRLAVVTSPLHTRRSAATFRKIFRGSGIEVGMYAAASTQIDPEAWWRTPASRFYVRYEWAALVWYAVRHQVNPFAVDPDDQRAERLPD
jgi:uncharacterized SAM-binding protein YcdF (DUF218 family)